jgi:peroxiredoxin
MSQEQQQTYAFAAFWLYKRSETWFALEETDWERECTESARVISEPGEGVTLRGTYASIGLNANADMIVWATSPEFDRLQQYAVAIDKSPLGRRLTMVESYIGVGGMSLYDKTHGPAFLKGEPPKRYLSVYPFTKTPDWYLVPFEERRRLMIEHGELGREYPTILTNTVNSFGIQDQEFIVALEDDDPHELIKMVQRLRAAEVRKYTAIDTPIYLGNRKPVGEVFEDLR